MERKIIVDKEENSIFNEKSVIYNLALFTIDIFIKLGNYIIDKKELKKEKIR